MMKKEIMHKIIIFLLLLLSAAISGCLFDTQNDDTKGNNNKKGNPVAGGTMTIAIMAEPDSLNPLLSDLKASRDVGRLIYSGLAILDNEYKWQPDLAVEIPNQVNGGISNDGKIIIWRLRDNVKWHDGIAVTADDVIFTWNFIKSGKSKADAKLYNKVANVEKISANSVKITLTEPTADFVTMFDYILPNHCYINEKDWFSSPINNAPIGSGPFKYSDWLKGSEIKLKANVQYHKGKPLLEGINCRYLPEDEMVINLFKTDEINLVSGVDYSLARRITVNENTEMIKACSPIWEQITLNTQQVALKDVNVRKALMAAIDRSKIIEQFYNKNGEATIADQKPVSPYSFKPQPDTMLGYEKITQVLDENGWKVVNSIRRKGDVSLKFTLLYPENDQLRQSVVQSLQSKWRDIGIEVDLVPLNINDIINNRLAMGKFDMAFFAWNMPLQPDNRWLWLSSKIPTTKNNYVGTNYSFWQNGEVDLLATSALFADEQTKVGAYQRIDQIIADEAPVISLLYRESIHVASKRLSGMSLGGVAGWNWWDSWQWGFCQ